MILFKKANCGFGLIILITLAIVLTSFQKRQDIRIAYFKADATPPLGSPVAYAPAKSITDSLSARGVVITGIGTPIVLATVDWIAIANEGMTVFTQKLARAAGTTTDRVSIHILHQHDTPRCDFSSEKLMAEHGLGGTRYDNVYLHRVIDQTASALKKSMKTLIPVTHISSGKAEVDSVASNRRILGVDGKVAIVRFSSARDPKAIAAPEGLIDPWLKSVSFWSGDKPLLTMSYYATHPQSYYGTGDVTAEFVGMARKAREKATGVPQIFFVGAAGNIAAGKYNDGSVAMRPILASRIEKAMLQATQNAEKKILTADNRWKSKIIQLPVADHLNLDSLRKVLKAPSATPDQRFGAAWKIAWLEQQKKGAGVNVSALKLGKVWLLHLPAEIFVEYQLHAQKLRPGEEICTAGYGEGGQGYIGTELSYSQGGYEVSERVSNVSPKVENVLMSAIRDVLK